MKFLPIFEVANGFRSFMKMNGYIIDFNPSYEKLWKDESETILVPDHNKTHLEQIKAECECVDRLVNISDLSYYQTIYIEKDVESHSKYPVYVVQIGNKLILVNGYHRIVDAVKKGEKQVNAKIWKLS